MVLRSALLVTVFAACACAGSPSATMDLATPADLAPLCNATSHASADCRQAWQFTDGADLPVAMDHHGTVIVTTATGSFLYVVGGNNYHGVFDTVYVAPIGADGSLGAWGKTTKLPVAVAGQGIFVAHGRIFVAGGQNNGTFYASVQSAPVSSDGTLGAWRAETSLPAPRFHSYAATTPDFVYITGGVDDHFNATSTIFRAAINADGTLGSFSTEGTTFPVPRSHHAALVHDGYLFVAGGLTGNPTGTNEGLADVLSAPLAADGALGAWSTVGTFTTPPMTPSAFELDDTLYIVGGVDDAGDQLSTISAAAFLGNGTLSPFAPVLPGLPVARSHVHQTPVFGDHIYSIGGSIELDKTTAHVVVGTFDWTASPAPQAFVASKPMRSTGEHKPHCTMKIKATN